MTEYNVHICNPTRLDKQQLNALLKGYSLACFAMFYL